MYEINMSSDSKEVELENARIKYSAVLSLKSSEGEIQWSRYNAMLVINTIIIGFLGLAYNDGFYFPRLFNILFLLIPIIGIIICFAWYQMTNRGFFWTKFWMKKAYEIEKQIKSKVYPIQEGRDRRDDMGEGLTKNFSLMIIILFGLIYAALFIINVVNTTCCIK